MSKMHPKQRYKKAKEKIMDAILLKTPLVLTKKNGTVYIQYDEHKHIFAFNHVTEMDKWFEANGPYYGPYYYRRSMVNITGIQALEFFETFWKNRIGR